jgi:excisionase family DNA binding protein
MSAFTAQRDYRPRLVLTRKEASAYTGFSVEFLKRMVREGRIREVRDGRIPKLIRADLDLLPEKL